MIKIENLTFAYPSSYEDVFNNVSFQIDTDWKLGLVGRNAKGKTTFLNLLLGKYEYKGKIISSSEFTYFPYEVNDEDNLTIDILYEINPSLEEWRLLKEMSLLELKEDILYREFKTLSNGEKTKILLVTLFLDETKFLLIDEPTNHLDSMSRKKVASYLKKQKGFILVSHDRYFLDECVDHILSFERNKIDVQVGNFSSWLRNFYLEQEFEIDKNERLKKDITRLQKSSRQTAIWSKEGEKTKFGHGPVDRGFIGHKAAKMMKRSKVIESRRNDLINEKKKLLKNIESIDVLKFQELDFRSDFLGEIKSLEVIYDDKSIFEPVTFEINKGDIIFLEGINGSGKSSLLKLFNKENISFKGEFNLPSSLIISYVPQDATFLKGTLDEFASINDIDETLFKTILRKMDFYRIDFEKDMKDFSMGQKKKVLLAKNLSTKAHLYVWDEPLNYIDVFSRIQIENLIKTFKPTMILVEHDVNFKENLATKIININGKNM